MDLTPSKFVKIEGTKITVEAKGLAEAKLALKELKLKKKEFALLKKNLNAQQKELRAQHTHAVRTRGSMVPSGGKLGGFIRFFQRTSRDGERATLARNLKPLESHRQDVDAMISTIESIILKVEAAILKGEG